LAEELGNKRVLADVLITAGISAKNHREYDKARLYYEWSLTLYREMDHRNKIPGLFTNLGVLADMQADYEQAKMYYGQAWRTHLEIGDEEGAAGVLNNLGWIEYDQGNLEKARVYFADALALSVRAMSHPKLIMMVLITLTHIELTIAEDSASALKTARKVVPVLAVIEALLQSAGGRLSPLDQSQYDSSMATTRALLGDDSFEAAWKKGQSMTLDEVVALMIGQLEGAQETDRSDHPSKNLGELTAREQEVAALVAEGLSNRVIGERLILSTRTVDMHVRNALHKLGLASRVQLAAWAVRHGLAAEPPDTPGD
jgi:DNA-binding CsgD family transcriptional regulator